jgi:predicted O-methyltransferase YrrM
MQGSTARELARLAASLTSRPRDIGRYISQSIGSRRTPLQMGLPWISWAAIDRLSEIVSANHRVVEFGGGGSTVWFAERAASVLCIESSDKRAHIIAEELRDRSLENVKVELHRYPLDDAAAYSASSCSARIQGGQYDVIMIDGYEENIQYRPIAFSVAEHSVKPGGVIVVDDSWRYPQLKIRNRAKKHEEHRSTVTGRFSVTSTDIYYY